MPDNNSGEPLYSFGNNAYVPLEDRAGRVVLLGANSLFVMERWRDEYTAYSDSAFPTNRSVEIGSEHSTVQSPWRVSTQSSAHEIAQMREFGWHFSTCEGEQCMTSDTLLNNIEEFMVETEEDILDRNEGCDLFTDDAFYPEPITEDDLEIENNEVIVTDDTVVEFNSDNAVVLPSPQSDAHVCIACTDFRTVVGSVRSHTVRYTIEDIDVSQCDSIESNDWVIQIPLDVDIQFSEYMLSLADDITFTEIESDDAVVFDVEQVRENRLSTERLTGTVIELLGSGTQTKGYEVLTEDENVMDIPATSVVWTESSIDDIPAWAT